MSAEDRAALPLPPEMYEAVVRVARETARAEVRAAKDAAEAQSKGPNGGRSALQQSNAYEVPETVAGVPV
jgi:hypothetical protein